MHFDSEAIWPQAFKFRVEIVQKLHQYIVTCLGEGVLTSPDWPHTWQQSEDTCDWVIQGARDSDRVTLTMTFLQLNNDDPANCSTDQAYIDIRDGEDGESPLLTRLCGHHSPMSITSQGSSLYVHVSNTMRLYQV